jgi:biotin operon repressor
MTFDDDDLNRHFGRIWPVHVQEFSALLITLRRHFGGDLDRMLVLAIIGSRTLPSRRIDGLSYEEFVALRRNEEAPAPINLQSIADCSGIPRETVRRKIRDLEALGWIVRRENGYLIASAAAAKDLAPLTEATMKYLVSIGNACIEATTGR